MSRKRLLDGLTRTCARWRKVSRAHWVVIVIHMHTHTLSETYKHAHSYEDTITDAVSHLRVPCDFLFFLGVEVNIASHGTNPGFIGSRMIFTLFLNKTWEKFEHTKLPANLLDYFFRSNKSNINQWFSAHETTTCIEYDLLRRTQFTSGRIMV